MSVEPLDSARLPWVAPILRAIQSGGRPLPRHAFMSALVTPEEPRFFLDSEDNDYQRLKRCQTSELSARVNVPI